MPERSGPTRASLLAREQLLKHRIRALPLSEKLRTAADLFDAGLGIQALNVAKLSLSELEELQRQGALPKVSR